MEPGDRVRISDAGRERNVFVRRAPHREGVLKRFGTWMGAPCAVVLWDGRKSEDRIHPGHIEPAAPAESK